MRARDVNRALARYKNLSFNGVFYNYLYIKDDLSLVLLLSLLYLLVSTSLSSSVSRVFRVDVSII